ncbi:MAG: aminoglycoside phosphotransferase [Bacteroidota bacterium]
MVQLPKVSISTECVESLQQYQAEIDTLSDYASQVEKAKAIWSSRKQNQPFEEVKSKLIEMCSGARRCHYCEDSMADEMEHFRPKNLYPSQTFVWENYLYSCGPCNGPKGDQFAIFEAATGKRIELNAPLPASPPPGLALLINPREEDPTQLLFLDIVAQSFVFQPWADDTNTPEFQRAQYSIDILRLNQRADLINARKLAYGNYKARLKEYTSGKKEGIPTSQLEEMIAQIKLEQHPSVWVEMKQERTYSNIEELQELFDLTPEALLW